MGISKELYEKLLIESTQKMCDKKMKNIEYVKIKYRPEANHVPYTAFESALNELVDEVNRLKKLTTV